MTPAAAPVAPSAALCSQSCPAPAVRWSLCQPCWLRLVAEGEEREARSLLRWRFSPQRADYLTNYESGGWE